MEDINQPQSSEISNSKSCLKKLLVHSMYSSEDENLTVKDECTWGITTFSPLVLQDDLSMSLFKDKENETMKDGYNRGIATCSNLSLKGDHSMNLSKDKKNETMRDEPKRDIATFNNFTLSLSDDENKENFNEVGPLHRPLPSISHSLKVISGLQKKLIRQLVQLQEKYESLSKDDIKKVTAFTLGVTEVHNMKRIKHVTELTILNVKQIIEFAQRVPGFDDFDTGDKIKLLKGCCTEVMLLWLAKRYDKKSESTTFGNKCRYKREFLRCSGMGDYSHSIFEFCDTLRLLNINSSEYALITAIVIFTNRGSLLEPRRVKKHREYYTQILKAYVGINRKMRNNFLDKLVTNLATMQKLGNNDYQKWFSTNVYYKNPSEVIRKLLDNQEQEKVCNERNQTELEKLLSC